MNPASSSPTNSPHAAPAFPLLWTIGASGHRRLPDEAAARAAVKAEIASLTKAAADIGARLTAVSSIALGADLIFAEECLAAGIPWKCLLPFPKEEFRNDDFTPADWARVEECLARAYRVETLSLGIPPNGDARNLDYLNCGHRTVEQADVMMILWDKKPAAGVGGTGDMWEYTRTLGKPIWHFNTTTAQIDRVGWPGEDGEWKDRRLFNGRVTPLVTEAEALTIAADQSTSLPTATVDGLFRLFTRLDYLANQKQGDAQRLMQKVVGAHLLATTAAALSVTVITFVVVDSQHDHLLAVLAALAFSFLVLAKPALAWLALSWDRQLHKLDAQKRWVQARVAAELCRSALACWRVPQRSLKVFDEEDFPHFKRLIRSLRIGREMDVAANTTCSENDAVLTYLTDRLDSQADYFKGKHARAVLEHDGWQRKFNVATWFVIVVGAPIGLAETAEAFCSACDIPLPCFIEDYPVHFVEHVIAFLLIVAPFYATYALAMLTIRDCRRRRDRFSSLRTFLQRQKARLSKVKSSASRIAIIENTERMLLEELHEWHAVTQEVHV